MSAAYVLAEHDRMIASLIQAGTIEAVDLEAAQARVRVDDWVSAWLPWYVPAAGEVRIWRAPSIGEQCLLLSPSGTSEGGFILPGFYTRQFGQADNRANVTVQRMPDGAFVLYDWLAHEYIVDVPAGGRILLKIGSSSLELRDDGTTLTTPQFLVDAPQSSFTGKTLIKGLLSYLAGLVGQSGSDGAGASIAGKVKITGGDLTADGISLKQHVHQEQGDGRPTGPAQ